MGLYVDITKRVENFNLEVKFNCDDGRLGFLGQSGSGKSMTLKCISGIEKPDQGKIILNGKILFDSENNINLSIQERKVGYLFQNYALFPHMTVTQNIEIGIKNLDKKSKKNIVEKYIQKLNLNGLEKLYPNQISGGQAQRVAMARTLVTQPNLLLLDEPFSALDYHLRKNIEIELINILKEYKGQIIFVTHDIEESYRICDNTIVYNYGIAKNIRNTKELFSNPHTLEEAKICGYRNISKIEIENQNTVEFINWGYKHYSKQKIDNNLKYMAIREKYIYLSKNINSDENNFKVKKIIQNIHTYTIYLQNTLKKGYENIEVEIIKDEINISEGDIVNLNIDEDYICYF